MPRPLLPRLLAAATPAGVAASDADLLRRFGQDGDAAAFELIVRRHAAAVWAACRRILPESDAEDAGLPPAGRRQIPETELHVGSAVVLLERGA